MAFDEGRFLTALAKPFYRPFFNGPLRSRSTVSVESRWDFSVELLAITALLFSSQGISASSAARRARNIASPADKPPPPPPPPDTPLKAVDLELTANWTSTRTPLSDSTVLTWLIVLLATTHLPLGWLPGRALPGAPPSASDEDAWLDQQRYSQAATANKSASSKHRNPFLRFIIWAAARGKPVAAGSIVEDDLIRFAVALNTERRNKNAARSAVAAVNYVCKLNNTADFSKSAPLSAVLHAASVAFSVPKKKAPEISIDMTANIVLACCADDQPDWRFMFGASVLCLSAGMCRFSDMARLRWEKGYFDVFDTHIRLFVDYRKNDPLFKGHFFDVALGDDAFAPYGVLASDVLLAGRRRFGVGAILRRIHRRGGSPHLAPPFIETGPDEGEVRTMSLSDFNALLRVELIRTCGLTPAQAEFYSSHGGRAGTASQMVRMGVPWRMINRHAGVVGENWLADYDRADLPRRLDAARSIGLG